VFWTTLVRSIRVYRYNFPPTIGEIRIKLEKNKTIPNIQPDQNDPDKKISIPSKIDEIKQHAFGITGYIRYGFQKKNEFSTEERFDITSQEYNFLISPKNGVLILHGPIIRSICDQNVSIKHLLTHCVDKLTWQIWVTHFAHPVVRKQVENQR